MFNGIPVKQIRENSITELDLKGSEGKQLESFGGIILGHVMATNTSVKCLGVSGNGLGPDGGKALAVALATNQSITTVRGSCCTFMFACTIEN